MNNRKGFTLVELLAVIAILAVILTIVVPKVYKSIDESKRRACNIQLNYIKDGAATFFAKNRYIEIEPGITYDQAARDENGVNVDLIELNNSSILKGTITNPITGDNLNPNKTKINIRNNDESFTYVISIDIGSGTWEEIKCE